LPALEAVAMPVQGNGFLVQVKSRVSAFSQSTTACWTLSTTHRKAACSLAAALTA
jgi:hypothetical protein